MQQSQFGAPRGVRGRLAAHVVARLTGEANRWMVDRLAVGRHDQMLDVGCGPGLAVRYALDSGAAAAVGVDASALMVASARRRNRAAVRAGRAAIRQADAARLPFPDASFTKAGTLNSLQFWPEPDQGIGELYRVLEPGGSVAVVLMARSDEPPGPASPPWVQAVIALLLEAGFTGVRIESRTFGGVLHRALLGTRPTPQNRMAPLSTPRRTG